MSKIENKNSQKVHRLNLDLEEQNIRVDMPQNISYEKYPYINVQNPTSYQLNIYLRVDFDVINEQPFAVIPPTSFQSICLPYEMDLQMGVHCKRVQSSNLNYTAALQGDMFTILFTPESLNWNFNAGLDIYAEFNAYQEALMQLPDGYPSGAQMQNLFAGLNMLQTQMDTLNKISTAGNFFSIAEQINGSSIFNGQSLFAILLNRANVGNTGNMLIPSYVTDFKVERLNPSIPYDNTTGFSVNFKNPYGFSYGSIPFNDASIYTTRDKIFLRNKEILMYTRRFFYTEPQTGTRVFVGSEIVYPDTIIDIIDFTLIGNVNATGRISGNVYFEAIPTIDVEVAPPPDLSGDTLDGDMGNFITSDFNVFHDSDDKSFVVPNGIEGGL